MSTPLISIILPIFNQAKYLAEAIESILNQTFTDFELLIIDDASTDSSLKLIKTYQDKRIRLFTNKINKGLAACLNLGIKEARSNFVARMDGDDISYPQRLAHQYTFMQEHSEVAVYGSALTLLDSPKKTICFPRSDGLCRAQLIFRSPFAHPSVMIRKYTLNINQLTYDETLKSAQDYNLWMKLSLIKNVQFANHKQALVSYRQHAAQTTQVKRLQQLENSLSIVAKLFDTLNIGYSEAELKTHRLIMNGDYDKVDHLNVEKWFSKLFINLTANEFSDSKSLKRILSFHWFEMMMHQPHSAPSLWRPPYFSFDPYLAKRFPMLFAKYLKTL